MRELIAQLEGLAGPCRQADQKVAVCIRNLRQPPGSPKIIGVANCGRYTLSVDTALSLIPEGWVIVDVNQRRPCLGQWEWAVTLGRLCEDGKWECHRGCAKKAPGTFAIALCIAALKIYAKDEQ